MAFSLAAAGAGAATRTWTGAANNNLWCDADNWDSGGETIDFTAENAYVFNDLPVGTVLTVASAMKFSTLTMKTNTVANATWKITGSGNVRCSGTKAITVPTGCTLNLDVSASNPWNQDNAYTLSGGGTLRHTKAWYTWSGSYYIKGASTFIFGVGSSGFDYSHFSMTDAATLKLEKNTEIVRAYSNSGTPTIDLNGFNLTYNFGVSSGDCEWTGSFTGLGTESFILKGERNWKINTSPTFGGLYDIVNAWLEMGSSSVSLPAQSAVCVRGSGQLLLKSDQTLSVIYGSASTGGIDIPANATLTVTGTNGVETASTFQGRLTGAGGLVKSGEDYTLTLTGENRYSGPTRVEEGTLELKRDLACSDIAYHFTLDGDGYLTDIVRGVSLTTANSPSRSLGDGAIGDCVSLDKTQKHRLVLNSNGALSNRVYTISMWIRTTNTNVSASSGGTLFCWGGGWNGNGSEYKLAHLWVESTTHIGGHGKVGGSASAGTTLTDGNWHHVVYTQETRLKSLWIDGVLCGTYVPPQDCETMRGDIQFGGVDTWGFYSGSFDEIILANGVWSKERIKRETARCRAANDLPNIAATLPQPVAKWTFDENYTDSINGIALVSRGTGTPTLKHDSGDGAYGKYVRLTSSAALGLADGAEFPECIPTGRMPFTVSIRYRHQSGEYRHAFGWGDTSTASKFFAVGVSGSIRRNSLNWTHLGNGASTTLGDASTCGSIGAHTWEHIVVTYDGTTIKAYRDGVYAYGSGTATLDIKPQDLYFGYRPNVGYYCDCDIDDVRVWNRVLTADQVRTLAQSLETGVVGSTLPSTSPVTVDAGAVLKVTGYGHEASSLAGAGTVQICPYSELRVNGAFTCTGALTGCGSLVLPSGTNLASVTAGGFTGEVRAESGTVTLNNTFAGGVLTLESGAKATGGAMRTQLAEGYAVVTDRVGTGLPIASGAGTAVIPATGSVTFSSKPRAGDYVLMEAGAFEEPEDYSGWTVSGTAYTPQFAVMGGRFVLRLNGGVTIIFR